MDADDRPCAHCGLPRRDHRQDWNLQTARCPPRHTSYEPRPETEVEVLTRKVDALIDAIARDRSAVP